MLRRLCLLLAALHLAFPGLVAAGAVCPDLTPASAGAELARLREEIGRHDRLYYQALRPELSDAQYDLLQADLLRLEQCFPALSGGASPSRAVGSDTRPGARLVPHQQPMLSLTSSTGPEAVEALCKRLTAAGLATDLLVQPKVDGLPVELTYLGGRLVSAATRGDGRSGEEVTDRVRAITGIPQNLSGSYPERVVVRGEIYADRAQLAIALRAGLESYATPRHFAAALLKAKSPAASAVAALRLFPFELVYPAEGAGLLTDRDALVRLADWGLPVRRDCSWRAVSLEQVRALYANYLSQRDQYPFAADGIVVKLDALAQRRLLGEGPKAPRWAAAWKFPPPLASSVVLGLDWQVGRTGRRTPVLRVTPAALGGIEVTQVSLHNAETLAKLGVTVGDRVVIALVGDVIPEIREVIKANPPAAALPAPQPAAAGPLACLSDSPSCRPQFIARVAHFASKAGLGIRGLGRGRVQKLVEAGLIRDIPSLFRLHPVQVAQVRGFSPNAARQLDRALRRAQRPQSFRLLAALGVPGVGPAAIRKLAREFNNLEEVVAGDATTGGTAALKTRSFFATSEGVRLLQELRGLGLL